jgi:hypothetical protein
MITMDVKDTIDYVGVDSILEQMGADKPKDFDFNKPLVQFIFVVIGVVFWPLFLIAALLK